MTQVNIIEGTASTLSDGSQAFGVGCYIPGCNMKSSCQAEFFLLKPRKGWQATITVLVHSSKPVMIHFKSKMKTKLEGKT